MATFNPDTANGFTLITPKARMRWYDIGTAVNSFRIGLGDPIVSEASGYVDRAGNDQPITGIAMGFLNASGVPVRYCAAGATGYKILVCDDPHARYIIQPDGYTTGSTAVAATEIGANAHVVIGNCDTTTGRSIYELDASDLSGTAATARQLRIVGLWEAPLNEFKSGADGRFVKLVVQINQHFYKTETGI